MYVLILSESEIKCKAVIKSFNILTGKKHYDMISIKDDTRPEQPYYDTLTTDIYTEAYQRLNKVNTITGYTYIVVIESVIVGNHDYTTVIIKNVITNEIFEHYEKAVLVPELIMTQFLESDKKTTVGKLISNINPEIKHNDWYLFAGSNYTREDHIYMTLLQCIKNMLLSNISKYS